MQTTVKSLWIEFRQRRVLIRCRAGKALKDRSNGLFRARNNGLDVVCINSERRRDNHMVAPFAIFAAPCARIKPDTWFLLESLLVDCGCDTKLHIETFFRCFIFDELNL